MWRRRAASPLHSAFSSPQTILSLSPAAVAFMLSIMRVYFGGIPYVTSAGLGRDLDGWAHVGDAVKSGRWTLFAVDGCHSIILSDRWRLRVGGFSASAAAASSLRARTAHLFLVNAVLFPTCTLHIACCACCLAPPLAGGFRSRRTVFHASPFPTYAPLYLVRFPFRFPRGVDGRRGRTFSSTDIFHPAMVLPRHHRSAFFVSLVAPLWRCWGGFSV